MGLVLKLRYPCEVIRSVLCSVTVEVTNLMILWGWTMKSLTYQTVDRFCDRQTVLTQTDRLITGSLCVLPQHSSFSEKSVNLPISFTRHYGINAADISKVACLIKTFKP